MKRIDRRYLGLVVLVGLLADSSLVSAQYGQYGQYGAQAGARIWIEGEPDYFQRGERLDVRFTVPHDAYVAVVHVDPDGNLDFLYPGTPWDVQMVRAGRVHSLPARGTFANTTIRSRSGIGYLYLIASPYPLDFSHFRSRLGSTWDWGYAGRSVHGDPFLAFEQLTRFLIPRWPYSPYVHDFYGYHVGGLHRYPTFACSDRFYEFGWGWTPNFGPCGRVDLFLRDYPYYFDTRRFRGDRRAVLRHYDQFDPRHGFKESPRAPASTVSPRTGVTDVRSPAFGGSPAADIQRREPVGTAVPQRSGEVPQRSAVPQRAPAPPRDAVPAPQRETSPTPRAAPPAPQRDPAPTPRAAPPAPQRDPAPRAAPPPSRAPEPRSQPSGGTRARPTPDSDGGRSAAPASGGDRAPARGRP